MDARACEATTFRSPGPCRKRRHSKAKMQEVALVLSRRPLPELLGGRRNHYLTDPLGSAREYRRRGVAVIRRRCRRAGPYRRHSECPDLTGEHPAGGRTDSGRQCGRHRRCNESIARGTPSVDPTQEPWSEGSRPAHRPDALPRVERQSHRRTRKTLSRRVLRPDEVRSWHRWRRLH